MGSVLTRPGLEIKAAAEAATKKGSN